MSELISIDEARRLVLAAVEPLPAERVRLDDARGRVLAADLESPIDVPPFDGSAMDGYAVVAGPGAELEVDGESRAGRPASERLRDGAAIRISTGAAVPSGADAVVPLERAKEQGARVRVPDTVVGDNVRYAGEDIPAGSTVLRAGTVLDPAALGAAAAVGSATLSCARRPRVAVLVTGDELTRPGTPLAPGGIYSSNAYALGAQAEAAGAELVRVETVPDRPERTLDAFAGALEEADVVIASGGVSVGPHDHVKPALAELGVEERFWGVRLRPGKPAWFGVRGSVLVFGLPGNPVSAMVTFELFVRPALAALQGGDTSVVRASATLDEPVPLHPSREQAIRVRLRHTDDGLRATTTGEQGSHMLSSMLGADGLARVAPGEGELAAGTRVEVELL